MPSKPVEENRAR